MANSMEHQEFLQAQSPHAPTLSENAPQSITIHLMAVTPTATSTATNRAGQISVQAIPLPCPVTQRSQLAHSSQGPPFLWSYCVPNALKPDGMWSRQITPPVSGECPCAKHHTANCKVKGVPPMCCFPIPLPAYSSEASGSAVPASSSTPDQAQSMCYQVQYVFCPDDTEPELEGELEAEVCTPGSFNDVRGDDHCRCCGRAHPPQVRKVLRKSRVNKKPIKADAERPHNVPSSSSNELEHLKIICESLGRALAIAATAAVEAAASKYAERFTSSHSTPGPQISVQEAGQTSSRETENGQTNESIEVSKTKYQSINQQGIGGTDLDFSKVEVSKIPSPTPVAGSDRLQKKVANVEPKTRLSSNSAEMLGPDK